MHRVALRRREIERLRPVALAPAPHAARVGADPRPQTPLHPDAGGERGHQGHHHPQLRSRDAAGRGHHSTNEVKSVRGSGGCSAVRNTAADALPVVEATKSASTDAPDGVAPPARSPVTSPTTRAAAAATAARDQWRGAAPAPRGSSPTPATPPPGNPPPAPGGGGAPRAAAPRGA